MRDDKEGRKKQARSNKHNKAKQNSTPKAVSCLGYDSNPRHSTLSLALPAISHSLLSTCTNVCAQGFSKIHDLAVDPVSKAVYVTELKPPRIWKFIPVTRKLG